MYIYVHRSDFVINLTRVHCVYFLKLICLQIKNALKYSTTAAVAVSYPDMKFVSPFSYTKYNLRFQVSIRDVVVIYIYIYLFREYSRYKL